MKKLLNIIIFIDFIISGIFIFINIFLPKIFDTSFHKLYFLYNIDILYYYIWKYLNIVVNLKTAIAILMFFINIIKRNKLEIDLVKIFLIIPSIVLVIIITLRHTFEFIYPYGDKMFLLYMFVSFIGLILLVLTYSEKILLKRIVFSIINPICYFLVLLPIVFYD